MGLAGNHGKPWETNADLRHKWRANKNGDGTHETGHGKKGNTHGDAHGNSMEIHAPKIVPGWIGSITPHKTRNLDRNLDLQMQMVPDLERVEKCPGR